MSDSASARKTAPRKVAVPPGPSPERSQREASDPKSSVWVAASAGSGKTTVLTSRVMRLLLDGVSPQRILCLTFTRAAAAEMANRVTARLSLWATCNDAKLGEDIADFQGAPPKQQQLTMARRLFARVLACPGGMRIRTIHAFCQELLGRFPVEAGLPPHFAVIDETDANSLMDEVLRDRLKHWQTAPESAAGRALRHLAQELGEHGFMPAMRGILRSRAKLDAALAESGGIEPLIARMRVLLALEPGDTEESIVRAATDFAVLPREDVKQAAIWLQQGTKKYQPRGANILAWLTLSHNERSAAFESYWRCFLTKDEAPFADFGDKKLLDTYPDLERMLAREATRLQSVLERLEAARIAETGAEVLRLGNELAEAVARRKASQAALDYDDLIIRADKLLHRPGIAPWVLYKLDGGLDHILVDEAQDTSRAQWSIVEALADEFFAGTTSHNNAHRTLFVVGDEKQSIFSFQNADPEAFAEMRATFSQRLEDAKSELRPVPMHTSFRSAPTILKAVDHVFAAASARAGVTSGEIHHFPARRRADEPEKIGRVEVWPLLAAAPKEAASDGVWTLPLDYEDEHDPQAELAHRIAAKIGDWLATHEALPGMERPIRPGDILILLRNRGRFADLMVRALKKIGVPVTGVDRMHLVRQLPVMDLLALVRFMLLPEDDLNLATVLRGPLLGCSEEQLMTLAIGREGSLWQSLAAKAQSGGEFAKAANYLARWLKEADFTTPFTLLAQLLNEPCPGNAVSGRKALWARLGPDALDPIEELLNAAQDFSARHAPSLEAFVHWITAADKVIKRELDPGGGEVRIMTVHGAKGLEAPIVFLPDTTGTPRAQDVDNLLWSDDGIPLYLPRKPKTGAALHLWAAARQKQMEEYRRLLYVALTRAANRLYIGGWEQPKQHANPSECWHGLIESGLRELHEPSALTSEDNPQPIIAFADPILREIKSRMARETPAVKIILPLWARQAAKAEPGLLDVFAPSHWEAPGAAAPDSAYARGRIIHRLLQSLPGVAAAERDAAATRFLANPRHGLTPQQQDEIRAEVMGLFRPEYAPLFGPESRAEVPLTGHIDGHAVAGQVDRLCLVGDEVWIVDYKSSRPPPANAEGIPPAYLRQMEAYRLALQDIYPGKAVRCFLLWTYKAYLMPVPDKLLSR